MPAVAEWLRRAYPALLERAGVGSIPTNFDAQHVLSFRRWRFEMKLSPFTPEPCAQRRNQRLSQSTGRPNRFAQRCKTILSVMVATAVIL